MDFGPWQCTKEVICALWYIRIFVLIGPLTHDRALCTIIQKKKKTLKDVSRVLHFVVGGAMGRQFLKLHQIVQDIGCKNIGLQSHELIG